ncbi:hypothetical protein PBI_TRIKE_41 [Mycobacterium phage Trike]|uniref:hypothetical protein n=1 Tax=Mycobacterium phage Trike TaxID=1527536 RepID=UPI0004EF8821|nr:hypothetical protein VC70_gp30 [Mycobacterium phage Trike]AIK69080.1 hypothetical protein PBI_TRIKE_41 [Mycobacterium phage Trike]
MLPPEFEGSRCLYRGHLWAVIEHREDNDELMLVRALIPMSKYDTAFVHMSEVEFQFAPGRNTCRSN